MILAELSLNLPILSAVLLLIAGVLVGYAIAFPLRGDANSVAVELRALREQNEDLESALQQQRDAYARLERRDRQRDDEWLALQGSNRRMETALNEHAQSRTAGDDRSREIIQQKDAALANLAGEREQRAILEERCNAQLQAMNELRTTAEDFRDLQAKYNVLREEMIHKQELLGRAEEQLAKSQEALAARDDEIRVVSGEHSQFDAQQREFSQKIVDLESALTAQKLRIEELQVDHSTALDQLADESRQRLELEELLDARERDARELAQDACLVEERDQEIQQLKASLSEAKTALAQQTAEQEKLAARLNEQHARTEHLQHDLDSHRRAFDTVGRQRDELRESRDDLANRLVAAEEKAAASVEDRDRVAQLERTIEGYQHQLRQQQMELESTSRRLRDTLLERDTAHAHVAELQDQLDQIQRQLHEASDKQNVLRGQREEILEALRGEEQRRIETAKALEQKTQQFASLGDEISQLEPLREELSVVRQQVEARDQQLLALRRHANEIDQLKTDLSVLRESLDEAQRAADEADQRARDAQAISDQYEHAVAQLCHDRDQALAELRALKVNAIRDTSSQQTPPDVAREHHPTRGLIYLSAPEVTDDLRRISGIAAVLESRLQALGIYTYEQIMNWDQANIDEFSTLLSFPDRIARDNWVGQAAELYQAAYGKAA